MYMKYSITLVEHLIVSLTYQFPSLLERKAIIMRLPLDDDSCYWFLQKNKIVFIRNTLLVVISATTSIFESSHIFYYIGKEGFRDASYDTLTRFNTVYFTYTRRY